MEVFMLQKDGYRKHLPKAIGTTAGLLLAVFAFVLYFKLYSPKADPQDTKVILVMSSILIVGVLILSVYRLRNMYRKNWESYRLLFYENSVSREHHGLPTLTIPYSEITAVEETKKGNLLIRTDQKNQFIAVPADIADKEMVRSRLASVKEITKQAPLAFWNRYPILISVGMLTLMAISFTAGNKWLVTVASLSLIILLIWLVIEQRKYRHLIQKQARLGPVLIALLMIPLTVRIVYALGLFGTAALEKHSAHKEAARKNREQQNFPLVILYLDSALALQPAHAYDLADRADAKMQTENYEGALDDYTKAIALQPTNASFYCDRGYVRYLMESYIEAKKDLNQAIQLGESSANAYLYLGFVEEQNEQLKAAENNYTKAIQYDTEKADAYFYRGLVRQQQGNISGACEDWQKQMELGDNSIQDSISKYCSPANKIGQKSI